jgi:hypothetical protein
MITILLLLIAKHFICDGPLQTPYQFLNKGKYGHPGGLIHAGNHGLGTLACFVGIGLELEVALWLGIFDTIIHYHIDWIKMKYGSDQYSKISKDINGKSCLCIYDNKFFLWLIADQCLHFATYVLLTFVPLIQIG